MPLPSGLVFAPDAPRRVRRRRFLFAAFALIASLALSWPIYPLFSGTRPFLLGLPLSFAWVVLWLVLIFAALLWLFRTDEKEVMSRE